MIRANLFNTDEKFVKQVNVGERIPEIVLPVRCMLMVKKQNPKQHDGCFQEFFPLIYYRFAYEENGILCYKESHRNFKRNKNNELIRHEVEEEIK